MEIGLGTIGAIGFLVMLVLFFLGMPIAVALTLVGFVGFGLVSGFDQALPMIRIAAYRMATMELLTVIPLFIFMGALAAKGGLSSDLFSATNKWLGHLRGGLCMAAVGGCTGFAAVCGDSIATALTMSQVSLPEMRKYGYNDQLSLGTLASAGLLGFMIPPSIPLIVYSFLTEASIGRLFIAGIVPGLLIAVFFMFTIYIVCRINPSMGPAAPRATWRERFSTLGGVWGVLALFIIVLGGIYAGIFTATEAGAVGAFGALVLGLAKRRIGVKNFIQSLLETLSLSGMIVFLIIGAMAFNLFISVTEIPFWLGHTVIELGLSPFLVLLAILVVYIIMGFFMNVLDVMLITIPIVFPFLEAGGIDLYWFGILCVLTVMIGQVTPPLGQVAFAVAGSLPEVPMSTVFRGIWPFFFAMVAALVILIAFPQVSLLLPNLLMKPV